MSEKRYMLTDFDSEVEMLEKINEQQSIIDKLQRYNDVLHEENLLNTWEMMEFMKEKGVLDEFCERIKKEVFGDE